MPELKLISADSHVNEPPAAWERVQKEYGERAPKVVKDPTGVPKGIWLLIEGIPPVGLSHYSKGQVVGKDKGISEVEQEKHFIVTAPALIRLSREKSAATMRQSSIA
jgi:hypothetical protein